MTLHEVIKLGLGCVAGVFGFAAGILWLFASLQKVRPGEKSRFASPDILISLPDVDGEDVDVLATAARQTFWNAYAALCAALASMFQLPLIFMS